MSRRTNNKATTLSTVPRQNDSHPQEHYPVYRDFLMRSLDRCDTELAALVKLNRSLRVGRDAIVEHCGQATLLDIGEGLIKLDTNNNDNVLVEVDVGNNDKSKIPITTRLTKEQRDLCVDFMLRMKLRRKLLNRLSRRLNRLSHAMDGEDVQPPHPPKYGDVSLQMDDDKAIQEFEKRWKLQEAAVKNIQLRNESVAIIPAQGEQEQPSVGEDTKDDDKTSQDDPEAKSSPLEAKEGGAAEQAKTANDDSTKMIADEGSSTKTDEEPKLPATNEESRGNDENAGKAESTNSNVGGDRAQGQGPPEETERKPDDIASLPNKDPPSAEETLSANAQQPAVDQPKVEKDDDYEVLRDYDEAYTKEIMPSTGAVTYPILEKTGQDEHTFIKYGGGIGATHRTMSSKDREAEFKRWQTAVLGRIPDQPTFEELGLANRVFFLEERRKQLAEENVTSPTKQNKEKTKDVEMGEADDNDDGDEEFKAEEDKVDDDGESEMDTKDDDGAEDKKAKEAEAKSVPIKPISMVAVPSYHEQDQKRMRLIHMDLMVASMQDHARRRVAEATQEYNQAFRRSTQLYNYRIKLQADLGQINYDNRMKLAQLNNEYTLNVAVNRKRWEKRHREHALGQLPSAYGEVARGTQMTFEAASSTDPIVSNVGKALADIVDAVTMRGEKGWREEDRIEEFVPPTRPDFTAYVDEKSGETFGQTQERLEGGVRRQLADLAGKLHMSEEDRKKAWRKLLKTKAEFDMPHTTNAGGGRGGTVSFAPNQFHLLPVPPLTGSVPASVMPTTYNYSSASLPSYVPPPSAAAAVPGPGPRANSSDSKYSAAKVRERIAPDGSVMPASQPKKKDGMYVRPPGRGRIGMDWDEVRGLWVPIPP